VDVSRDLFLKFAGGGDRIMALMVANEPLDNHEISEALDYRECTAVPTLAARQSKGVLSFAYTSHAVKYTGIPYDEIRAKMQQPRQARIGYVNVKVRSR
jgi:hypothetical protein